MAAWLAAKPLTTHVVVVALQCGDERPQPWQDPIARVIQRDLPTLQATICSRGVGRQHPGALPWLWDCVHASSPPTQLRSALEGLYGAGDKHGSQHYFLVATDHGQRCATTLSRQLPTWHTVRPPTP